MFIVIPIRRETRRMGMKKNFVTLNFQIVT